MRDAFVRVNHLVNEKFTEENLFLTNDVNVLSNWKCWFRQCKSNGASMVLDSYSNGDHGWTNDSSGDLQALQYSRNNRSTKVVTLESREHTGGCACLEYLTIYNKEITGHLFWALAASMLFSEHRRIVHPMSRDNSVNCGDESVPKRGRKIDVCDAGP